MRPELEPACAGNPWPYDVLIDEKHGPTREFALMDARRICGVVMSDIGLPVRTDNACPLIDRCLIAKRDEPWAAAILGLDTHKPAVQRDSCGTPQGYDTHHRHSERPCDACKEAGSIHRMARKWAKNGITAELRAWHSENVRLRAAGVPLADIPRDVTIGEKAYQMARYKARQEAAA